MSRSLLARYVSLMVLALSPAIGVAQYGLTDLTPLPEPGRDDACLFGIGDYLYVTGGGGDGFFIQDDLWRYDILNDEWEELSGFPGAARQYLYAGVIDNVAYLVGGRTEDGLSLNELWSYSPETNSWQSLDPFPGTGRYKGVGFVFQNRLYYGTGRNDSTAFSDLWEYDPANAAWRELPPLPSGPRNEACAFVIDGEAYIAGGLTLEEPYLRGVWALDLISETWRRATDLPQTLAWAEAACSSSGPCTIWDGKTSVSEMSRVIWNVNSLKINGKKCLTYTKIEHSGPGIRNSSVCSLGGTIFRFGGKDSVNNKFSKLTSLSASLQKSMKIYPIPSAHTIHVEFSEPWSSGSIIDLQGSVILDFDLGLRSRHHSIVLDGHIHRPGYYLLLVENQSAQPFILNPQSP